MSYFGTVTSYFCIKITINPLKFKIMYIPNLETLKRVIKSIAHGPIDPDVLRNVPIAPEIQRHKPKFPKGTKVFY